MIFASLKSVENKIKKLGFKITNKDKLIVQFKRENKQFNYIHGVDIVHKKSGKHIIQSFQNDSPISEFDYMVGLTFEETELFLKYAKKLKW